MKLLPYHLLRKCKHFFASPIKMAETALSVHIRNKTAEIKRAKKRDKIKIGFIVQMPEVWDKEAPLFEALLQDKRFECFLVIVPHYDFSRSQLCSYGDEKDYFSSKYPEANIILLNRPDEAVVNDSFDYVFYQRCWEHYLPEQLRCKNVIKHALTCYIPYCFHAAPEPTDYYQTDFFRYLSRFYCCSKDQCEQVRRIKGLDAEYLGFPVIDSVSYEDVPHSTCNILWTPRWTDDPAVGGTSFNRNRSRILELPALSDDIRLTLRPHPLTFENAIKENWMTASEIEEYKQRVYLSGACFDKNTLIEETFLETDILITDFTSAILPFFLSGRPVIYCTDPDFVMIDTFREIIGSLYIAHDWDDLLTILRELMSGNDPLYEKRQSVIKSLKPSGSSVNNITEDLVKYISNHL